jgi:transcriptional regulator with XRE-family HTH domain
VADAHEHSEDCALTRGEVSALVKRIRAARHLTQEQLARELGVTFSTVNTWENGKHVPIPAHSARLIEAARAAGLDLRGTAPAGVAARPSLRRRKTPGR